MTAITGALQLPRSSSLSTKHCLGEVYETLLPTPSCPQPHHPLCTLGQTSKIETRSNRSTFNNGKSLLCTFRGGSGDAGDYLLMTWRPVVAWVLADYWRTMLSAPPEALAAAGPDPGQDGSPHLDCEWKWQWPGWTRHRSRSTVRHRCQCPPDPTRAACDATGRRRPPWSVSLAGRPWVKPGTFPFPWLFTFRFSHTVAWRLSIRVRKKGKPTLGVTLFSLFGEGW